MKLSLHAIRNTLYASLFTLSSLYICREPSTNQLLFMQNKPNFRKSQMNANPYNTTDYENKWQRRVRKNKPNTNPNKANFRKAKMNINSIITKDYIKKDDFAVRINKPNLVRRRRLPKMNANLYVLKDYENKTALRPQKNKPKQSQFHLLNFHLKIRRPNQLLAASARANVTAQPAAIITIRAKMMYLTLTSAKKRSKKRKYTPQTAITKAKNAITTSTLHNNAQAGWIYNASKILPWAKTSTAVVIPHVGHGSPYLCWKPQYPSHRPILIL